MGLIQRFLESRQGREATMWGSKRTVAAQFGNVGADTLPGLPRSMGTAHSDEIQKLRSLGRASTTSLDGRHSSGDLRFPRHFGLPLSGLLLAALMVRFVALLVLSSASTGIENAHHEHASIAKSLATGNGFRFNFFGSLDAPSLTSIEAPLVPGLLAACYFLFGVESREALWAMLFLQIGVSSLTVVLLWWLAFRITDSRGIAWGTGVLAMVYPPMIVSGLHIQAVSWNLFWLAMFLVAALELEESEGTRGAGLFAFAGIGGLLTDPILVLVLVFLLGYLARPRSPSGARWRRSAGLAVIILVGISPWLIRNAVVHGRFVFVKDSFFYVLWQGNNAVSEGTDKLLVAGEATQTLRSAWNPARANARATAVRGEAVSVNSCLTPEFISELQSLPGEIQRMDLFRPMAIQAVFGHPRRYLGLCGQRLRFWLWFDETNPRSHLWHYRLSYLFLLGLTCIGLLSGRLTWKRCFPVLLAALGLSLVHVLVITSARFRIPLEMLLLIPAGVGTFQVKKTLASTLSRAGHLGTVPIPRLVQIGRKTDII